tara:strand:+ start:513 stop:1232 length:720 start_codon:yes stop_codon:yes gene_type:complete
MKKQSLQRYIEKYNLGGNVNSVVWNSDGKSLTTNFITDDKSLLGQLKGSNFNLENGDIGVYNTDQLIKLLSVCGSDVDINLSKADDKPFALGINDSKSKVQFMLSDLSVINQPPNLKSLPDFKIKIKIDKDFMDRFIKAKNALTEVDTFTVLSKDGNVDVVLGYSSINTNRVTIPVSVDSAEDCDPISFSAKFFKDVLVANKECSSAVLEVSDKGLSRINFKIDDFDVTYYLVAQDEVD